MNLLLHRIAFTVFLFACMDAQTFKQEQAQFSRVKSASAEKESLLKELCASKNILYPPSHIFIRIFKHEQNLKLWAKNATDSAFTLLNQYKVCSSSGKLGPKRKQGDGRVPEGFYVIDEFNPNSNFYLSLRINYPNVSDKILGKKEALGNNICIHGNCITIGCIPITDDKIKEVYVLAVEAKSEGQRQIPVHIFPTRMNTIGMKFLQDYAKEDTALQKFWRNIKMGCDFFEAHHSLPRISVHSNGVYLFQK